MMAIKFEQPIQGGFNGCLHCGQIHSTFLPENVIAVGFGVASLLKDGVPVYNENPDADWEDHMTGAQAEELAAKDPDCDWRIQIVGPLSEREYQRQGKDHWPLIRQGMGFA